MAEKVGSIYYDLDLDDKKFNKKVKNVDSSFEQAKKSSTLFLGALTATGVGLIVAGKKALTSAASFESMGVALETAFQGNIELAEKAKKQITDFASKTPFQLEEVLNGFIKLKNMGLDPSERALTSYGDTASAMGKSLNDMVEAVADAATGEFERLKEFGIKASSEGDRVKFTFRGVTTEVGKNSAEIEEYLMQLGETNFAGGMEKQSKTFNGLVSTLKDNFSIAMASIAEDSGLLDIAKKVVEKVTTAIGDFSERVKESSGFLEYFKTKVEENQTVVYILAGVVIGALVPAMVALAISIWTALAPLLPFIAAGVALGLVAKIVIDRMGGIDEVMKKLQPVLEYGKQQFSQIWELIRNKLWPALTDLWKTLGPILIPILNTLAKVGLVIFGAQVMFVIKVIKWLIQYVSWSARTFVSWYNMINSYVNGVISIFKSIVGFISRALSGVGEAIMKPFRKAFDWIGEKAEKAKNMLDKLNPFHKESPSLVEWIEKGTSQMVKNYDDMYGKLNSMSTDNRVGMVASAQSLNNATQSSKGVEPIAGGTVNNTFEMNGIMARSRGELREIAIDLINAYNENLISKGKNPLPT